MARAAVVVGSFGIVIGAFLPWVISGQTTRNSFTTVQVARALGVVESGPGLVVLAGWYFVPLAAVVVIMAVVLDRRRLGSAIAAGLGFAAVAFAGVVLLSPIESAVGVAGTFGAGLLEVAAAAVLFRSSTRRGDGGPTGVLLRSK